MSERDLWRNDATQLSRLIDSGLTTPDEILEESLARLDRLEPALNAFTYVDSDGARRAAAEATERLRAGRRLGLLDGIPVSIKDNLFVRGLPASWGSLLLKSNFADRDDICVERLRNAGAVIVGKTTTPEFALMGRTQSLLSGITRNPWNTKLTPGGSSGGAVASVAAGITPLAIGTDAGGSTRMPASYTGLVGLRPSNGRVPRRYGFPPMALDFQAIGLICRTLDDLKQMLTVVAGPDSRDLASVDVPPLAPTHRKVRIGWFGRVGDETSDPEVLSTLAQARDAFAAVGHFVSECDPPFDVNELRAIWDQLTRVGAARAAIALKGWEEGLTPQIAGLVKSGLASSAIEYALAIDRLQTFRAEVAARASAFDAFLLPSAPSPAWPAEAEAPATIGGRPGSGATQGMFCGWVNALGYCGLNVPGDPHPDGRPIGVQIVVRRGDDGLAIELAECLEEANPWRDRWPPISHL